MENFEDPENKIAICGVYCAACPAYMKRCLGCRSEIRNSIQKRKSKWNCKKRSCALSKGFAHCGECADLPCTIRKPLDKRYSEEYSINLVQNCRDIHEQGAHAWINRQNEKYKCSKCGAPLSPYSPKTHSCENG